MIMFNLQSFEEARDYARSSADVISDGAGLLFRDKPEAAEDRFDQARYMLAHALRFLLRGQTTPEANRLRLSLDYLATRGL